MKINQNISQYLDIKRLVIYSKVQNLKIKERRTLTTRIVCFGIRIRFLVSDLTGPIVSIVVSSVIPAKGSALTFPAVWVSS